MICWCIFWGFGLCFCWIRLLVTAKGHHLLKVPFHESMKSCSSGRVFMLIISWIQESLGGQVAAAVCDPLTGSGSEIMYKQNLNKEKWRMVFGVGLKLKHGGGGLSLSLWCKVMWRPYQHAFVQFNHDSSSQPPNPHPDYVVWWISRSLLFLFSCYYGLSWQSRHMFCPAAWTPHFSVPSQFCFIFCWCRWMWDGQK